MFLMIGHDDLARIRSYLHRARKENRVRLPPEPSLANELGVTRWRLRALLKELEAEGLIWRHVGKGTFIGQRSLSVESPSLAGLINPLDAFESRLLLEPQIAGLAALRASSREISEMEQCVGKMRSIKDFEEWAQWDERLHRIIATAVHNPLVLALYDTVRANAPTGMRIRERKILSGPRDQTNMQHEEFVRAIREHDSVSAESLMRSHLQSIRKALFGDM